MSNINIGRMLGVVVIAFIASFATVFGDGIRTSETKDIAELGAVLALYGGKALAAGMSASVSAVLAYLTMPFKDVQANSLKVGK